MSPFEKRKAMVFLEMHRLAKKVLEGIDK